MKNEKNEKNEVKFESRALKVMLLVFLFFFLASN